MVAGAKHYTEAEKIQVGLFLGGLGGGAHMNRTQFLKGLIK